MHIRCFYSVKMIYSLVACVGYFILQQVISYTFIRDKDLVIFYIGATHSTCDVEEHRFQTFLTNKLSDCVIECALREHCEVLTYHRAYKLCDLHQINDLTSNVTGNCFRVQKEDINLNQSPCSRIVCEAGASCDRNTGTCQIKECLEIPHLPNGRVRGNLRAVGHRIKYECDEGFILLNTTNERATCLENGKWSTYEKCVPAPAVGMLCTTTNCIHPTVHCVEKLFTESYCHCAFGYEFNEKLGICEQVCKEYSTNPLDFEEQVGKVIGGYNQGVATFVSTFEDCVTFCNKLYPYYLSIDFSYSEPKCQCAYISERQNNFAHGALKSASSYSFYNRPCLVTT